MIDDNVVQKTTRRSAGALRTRPYKLGLGGFILIAMAVIGALYALPAKAIERGPLNTALMATVRVIVPITAERDTYSTGSGTILNEDGLILTNYHVMGDIEKQTLYNSKGLAAIALNPPDLRSDAVIKYWAQLIKGDPILDLALLQIVAPIEDPNGDLPENLGLVSIPVGDSDQLQIGDELNIVGFPGVGGGSVTFTRGLVSGFLDEDQNGDAEWIKTDAEVNHGNSGGLATNEAGEFVGVPTQARTDIGAINLIRSGNIALAFAADIGVTEETVSDPNAPFVKNVVFAKAIDSKGNALKPAVRFDSGTDALYATFDYGNFQEGKTFEFVWYHNGFEVVRDSVVWTFDQNGATWVNVFNEDGLDDGYYELQISFDGKELFRDGVVIGEAPETKTGTFGPITFAEGITDDDKPVKPGTSFTGIKEVYAFFDVTDVPNGTTWSRQWYLDGELIVDKSAVWNEGDLASTWLSLSSRKALPLGQYRLDLLIEGEVVQSGEFEVVSDAAVEKEPEAVLIVGRVVEADKKRKGIAGASVFFLNEGITVADFLADPQDEMVFASGVSDENGYYQLDRKLVPGSSYSVVVFHEEYKLVAVDDFQIDSDATSPYEVNVTMERR